MCPVCNPLLQEMRNAKTETHAEKHKCTPRKPSQLLFLESAGLAFYSVIWLDSFNWFPHYLTVTICMCERKIRENSSIYYPLLNENKKVLRRKHKTSSPHVGIINNDVLIRVRCLICCLSVAVCACVAVCKSLCLVTVTHTLVYSYTHSGFSYTSWA